MRFLPAVACVLLLSPDVQAMSYPTGGSITKPVNSAVVCAGAQVTFTGTNGTDEDVCPSVTDNCELHWWGGGSFPDGCMGTSVKWRASVAAGAINIFAAGDDTGEPDTHEYDWPYKDNFKIIRAMNVLIPVPEEYNFSGDKTISDAQTPLYKKDREVTGNPFECEMAAAQKNGHLGLEGLRFKFSSALTYSSSVQVDVGGTLAYDASAGTFSGSLTPAMSLAGSGSNNLDNAITIQVVYVNNFKYRVEYAVGVYSSWISISGWPNHGVALLWAPPATLAKRKSAYSAAYWARDATSVQEVYDKMTAQKLGITYTATGTAQGEAILNDDPDGYYFTPSNASKCDYLAAFLNMLAEDYHGISGGSTTDFWGGTSSKYYGNYNDYPPGSGKSGTLLYAADGYTWCFLYHTMAVYGSKYYDICPTNGQVYSSKTNARDQFDKWYTQEGGGLRDGSKPSSLAMKTWDWY